MNTKSIILAATAGFALLLGTMAYLLRQDSSAENSYKTSSNIDGGMLNYKPGTATAVKLDYAEPRASEIVPNSEAVYPQVKEQNPDSIVMAGRAPLIQEPIIAAQYESGPDYLQAQVYYPKQIEKRVVISTQYKHKSGRVHVGRAAKHIILFSAKLPFKISP
ncbi:MAG: hypothetical protein K2X27_26670 [Candidatus Obscuribacterales bacterium]|nr:hypothetical protein [Candidatus Obscuribacterales bacterium]